MEDLGKAAEKSTDVLESTAVAMEEVEKKAIEMAKSVSGAVKDLVKLSVVAKALSKTLIIVSVAVKTLTKSILGATIAVGAWMKKLAGAIILLFGLAVMLAVVRKSIAKTVESTISVIYSLVAWMKSILLTIASLALLVISLVIVQAAITTTIDSIGRIKEAFIYWTEEILLTIESLEKLIVKLVVLDGVISVAKESIYLVCEAINTWKRMINLTSIALGMLESKIYDVQKSLFRVILAMTAFLIALSFVIAKVVSAILEFRKWRIAIKRSSIEILRLCKKLKELPGDMKVAEEAVGKLEVAFNKWNEELRQTIRLLKNLDDIIKKMSPAALQIAGVIFKGFKAIDIGDDSNNITSSGVHGQAVNTLIGQSNTGTNPILGGNSNNITNITYNVRTTKDMSLRDAERERRLYCKPT